MRFCFFSGIAYIVGEVDRGIDNYVFGGLIVVRRVTGNSEEDCSANSRDEGEHTKR